MPFLLLGTMKGNLDSCGLSLSNRHGKIHKIQCAVVDLYLHAGAEATAQPMPIPAYKGEGPPRARLPGIYRGSTCTLKRTKRSEFDQAKGTCTWLCIIKIRLQQFLSSHRKCSYLRLSHTEGQDLQVHGKRATLRSRQDDIYNFTAKGFNVFGKSSGFEQKKSDLHEGFASF